MTRSVEIPEAALKAAVDALYEIHYPDDPTMRQSQWSAAARVLVADRQARLLPEARASIEAALPYLASAKICSCRTVAPSGWDRVVDATDPGCVIHGQPAPAGDGGLREALAERLGEMEHYDTCASVLSVGMECHCMKGWLESLLAAHPAAPAVPQPVDREALAKLIEGADHYDTCTSMLNPDAGYECSCLLADLRVLLAGEQEQVEP